MDISNTHYQSDFGPLFIYIALQILRKVLLCFASIIFGVCYYLNVQFTPRGVLSRSHYVEQNLSWNIY